LRQACGRSAPGICGDACPGYVGQHDPGLEFAGPGRPGAADDPSRGTLLVLDLRKYPVIA